MKIISESIAEYIELNYDIEEFNDIKELEKVEELVINNYNYSFDIAVFNPYELSYFRNLKKCTFMNFEITDEIIDNLNKINVEELTLDNCNCNITNTINVEKLYIEVSSVTIKNINAKEITILDSGTINIGNLNNDLKELILLNCNIINCNHPFEWNFALL